MILVIKLASGEYKIETDSPLDISIPLDFSGSQPNAYGAAAASAKTCEFGSFIGDTRRGGNCNFEEYTVIPHCNGTHTECVGHISNERISIIESLKDVFVPSTLISIVPENAADTDEKYDPKKDEGDLLITLKNLKDSLIYTNKDFLQGLIIRTLPNDDTKKSRNYSDTKAPFFSLAAMEYIVSLGVKHLLVDIPSVDRASDEGKLSTHHIFWNVEQGSHEVDMKNHSAKTITEMIYVPDEVPDGRYMMNLQIAPFASDAAPSRPVLFGIKN